MNKNLSNYCFRSFGEIENLVFFHLNECQAFITWRKCATRGAKDRQKKQKKKYKKMNENEKSYKMIKKDKNRKN